MPGNYRFFLDGLYMLVRCSYFLLNVPFTDIELKSHSVYMFTISSLLLNYIQAIS